MSADASARRLAGGSPADAQATSRAALVRRLFSILTDGHPSLGYNVARAHHLFDQVAGKFDQASYSSEWRPARVRTAEGTLTRKLTPRLLELHVAGDLDVAVEAPAMSSRLVFDFDLPGLPPQASDDERLQVELRFWTQFSDFWASIGAGADKLPVVQRTPSRPNLHVDLPLDRPYPNHVIREWAEHHARKHGLRVEIFPSGKPVRAPGGRGTALLVPRNPDRAEDLQLEAPHVFTLHTKREDGTFVLQERRRIDANLADYVERYEAARRPLCEWLPGAPAWDELVDDGKAHYGPWGAYDHETSPLSGDKQLIQHTEDLGGRPLGPSGSAPASSHPAPAPPVRATRGRVVAPGGRSSVSIPGSIPGGVTSADDVHLSGSALLLHGPEWRATIEHLLAHGLTEPGIRHNSVLKLTWHWASEGHDLAEILRRIEEWCRAHDHKCRALTDRGFAWFVKRSRYDSEKYFESHCQHLAPRRAEGLRAPVDLAEADRAVLTDALPPELVDDGLALMAVLAAYADSTGRVASPVRLSGAMLCGVLGDRRVTAPEGGRRRLHVVLLEALQRLGILTLHRNYAAGSHGREFACWYRFGAGALPRRDDDGLLELDTREVQEGRLAVVTTGEPGARPTARIVAVHAGVIDRPLAWWRRMFLRRMSFTPGEFASDESRVVPFPWPARNPAAAQDTPALEVVERLGAQLGRVVSFRYASCYGHLQLDDGSLVFVHQVDIAEEGWRDLKIGQEVTFQLVRTPRGLRALLVKRALPGEAPTMIAPEAETAPYPTSSTVPLAELAPAEVDARSVVVVDDDRAPLVEVGPKRRPQDTDRVFAVRRAIHDAKKRGDGDALRRLLMELLEALRTG